MVLCESYKYIDHLSICNVHMETEQKLFYFKYEKSFQLSIFINIEMRERESKICCPTSYATIFQLYMWRHTDVQMDWRSWAYSRLPHHRHYVGFFNVPVQAPTRGQLFYVYSEKSPHFNRILQRAAHGDTGGPILLLNPQGPHRVYKYWDIKVWLHDINDILDAIFHGCQEAVLECNYLLEIAHQLGILCGTQSEKQLGCNQNNLNQHCKLSTYIYCHVHLSSFGDKKLLTFTPVILSLANMS